MRIVASVTGKPKSRIFDHEYSIHLNLEWKPWSCSVWWAYFYLDCTGAWLRGKKATKVCFSECHQGLRRVNLPFLSKYITQDWFTQQQILKNSLVKLPVRFVFCFTLSLQPQNPIYKELESGQGIFYRCLWTVSFEKNPVDQHWEHRAFLQGSCMSQPERFSLRAQSETDPLRKTFRENDIEFLEEPFHSSSGLFCCFYFGVLLWDGPRSSLDLSIILLFGCIALLNFETIDWGQYLVHDTNSLGWRSTKHKGRVSVNS